MSKKNNKTDGRGNSGSGSRQQPLKKSNNSNNDNGNVESFLTSGTLQSLTFGAPSRSSTNTTNASGGVDWTNLVRNGNLAAVAAANNNNTNNNTGNISNVANGAGVAATSTNQDNVNDSGNYVDNFAIGEKFGLKFVQVSSNNSSYNGLSPLLITTNPCGNDVPNVIAATSAKSDVKIGDGPNSLPANLLPGLVSRPAPGVSNVAKLNPSWTTTADGRTPPEKIYYQLQDVNHDETIQIDGKDFVIPAGHALVYADKKWIPFQIDFNLKDAWLAQQHSQATTLVALKDNGNSEVLAVLPCSRVVGYVVGKSKSHAANNTFKGLTYFDGDEWKTVDVKWVKYKTEHGDIGRVSVLGTKILYRRYLVLPSYERGVRGNQVKDWKEESAKHRVGILEEIGITEKARDKIYENLLKLEESLEHIVCPKMDWMKPGSL